MSSLVLFFFSSRRRHTRLQGDWSSDVCSSDLDFGELGVKSSSAQITRYYDKADLVGRLVLAVVNFPPRQIANFFSEVLTLGVVLGDGDIVLVHPERDVPLGSRIA